MQQAGASPFLDPAGKMNSYADASSKTGTGLSLGDEARRSQTSTTALDSAQPETQSKPQKRNRVLVSGPGVGNVSTARSSRLAVILCFRGWLGSLVVKGVQ